MTLSSPVARPFVAEARPLLGRAILLAEDEFFLAMDLQEALQGAGATVIGPVASVGQALRLLEAERRIDAAVLDVNLGGEMVFPVADRLLERGVTVLLATGYNEDDLPTRFARVPRCEKPIDVAALMRILAPARG